MSEKKSHSVSDLNRLFSESKSQLQEHLAESRTNVNLFVGNHFQKTKSKLSRGVENLTDNQEVKIRVTKNHTYTICKYIINAIESNSPTGIVLPKNEGEIQDQKSAEIHASVLEDYKARNHFKRQVSRMIQDFVVNGEVWVNLFWDDNKGSMLRKEPIFDPTTGEQTGEQTIMEGDAVTERVYSWDVRHDAGAKSIEEATWIGYEKMVDPDVVIRQFGKSEEIQKALQADMDETFSIFDGAKGSYGEASKKVLLRQIYFRPCTDYPNGLYIFFTKNIELGRGELPVDKNGRVFFPMKYCGFDEVPTMARAISIIRQIRPDQMEVNRCASAIAQTQMTVGFDKMIVPTGGEVESGSTKSGVRLFKVPGGKQNADYIQGRSGEQFLNTMTSAISEMYQKTGVPEKWDETKQDTDMLASLYKNMRQKNRFSHYTDKFTDFLTDLIMDILRLKKAYMRDESYIKSVGRSEYINIAEFRALDDLGYQIKIEGGSEDLESRFGKHIALTQTMQYMGNDLDDNTKGAILRNLEFVNGEEIFSKVTQQHDRARNILLALDRGEMPPISQNGDPLYIAEELDHRIGKPDFVLLDPAIQQNYITQRDTYNQLQAAKLQEVQMAQSGFIPADGPTVPVDGMYEVVMGGNGQAKSQRVQIPLAAIQWTMEKLKQQGIAFGDIMEQPLGMQHNLSTQLNQQSGTMPALENPMGPPQGF